MPLSTVSSRSAAFRSRTFILLTLRGVVMAVVGGVVFRNLRGLMNDEKWVDHTYQVLYRLKDTHFF